MDEHLSGLYPSVNGIKFGEVYGSILSGENPSSGLGLQVPFLEQNNVFIPPFQPDPSGGNVASWSSVGVEEDPQEDCDFSDVVIRYVSQLLMEEDVEEKTRMFQESLALEATEKSFYEVIGKEYPASKDHHLSPSAEENHENPTANYGVYSSSTTSYGKSVETGWNFDYQQYKSGQIDFQSTSQSSFSSSNSPSNIAFQCTSHSSFSSSNSPNTTIDGFGDRPMSIFKVPDIFNDSESVLHFKRGLEEASRFLPNGNGLFDHMAKDNSGLLVHGMNKGPNEAVVEMEKHANGYFMGESRGKKNSHLGHLDSEEERSNKQSAVCDEVTVTSEMFDRVLLCDADKGEAALRESLQNEASKTVQQEGGLKGSNGGRSRGWKKGGKKDLVDLRTLLTLCAQAVAADDRRSANEQLKQIRQHACPMGDGVQRMAYYFANGLEARLAGSGTQIYKGILTKPSAANVLKAYHLLLAVSPFKKVTNFVLNKTITKVAEKAARLHIIDFGIFYGFQWPSFIQRLSSRPGGPPKLRITGIDLPQPGFRPVERVEETGRRLANYARSFNVPFEFNAIAQKWETIQIEDLKINTGELVVVNCRYRFRSLLDESVVVESPRNIVLNLIRKMNPDIFIQGIVNGAYGVPFFMTRFREALFHFSALYDMLETNVPRQSYERRLIEKELFGWEAMNAIACEGSERIERPETYKQWQVRNERAGFRQLPLDQEIVKIAKKRVKSCYHKDFMMDEDGQWLLQGWKGRIIYAISSWKPAH